VLLDAPGRAGPLRFTVRTLAATHRPDASGARRARRMLAADCAVQTAIRRIAAAGARTSGAAAGGAAAAGARTSGAAAGGAAAGGAAAGGAAAAGCRTALLGYIARPRQPEALLINELGALARLRWSEAGWPWLEVTPLWLARFVSDADEGRAAEVWSALDAGRGMPGGSGGYGWAAALAHVARCAALPGEYDPWRGALARELARWG
jgi:hypothetical protein